MCSISSLLNNSDEPVIDLTGECSSRSSIIDLTTQSTSSLSGDYMTRGKDNNDPSFENTKSDTSLESTSNTTEEQPLKYIDGYYYITPLVKAKYIRVYYRVPDVFEWAEEGFSTVLSRNNFCNYARTENDGKIGTSEQHYEENQICSSTNEQSLRIRQDDISSQNNLFCKERFGETHYPKIQPRLHCDVNSSEILSYDGFRHRTNHAR